MKKTFLLLLLLVLSISCSNDDSSDVQSNEIYMKVISIGVGYTTGVPVYSINYGTSSTDVVTVLVNEKVYRFYLDRTNKNNIRWIGEVDHE